MRWLQRLWHRKRLEEQLERELRFHLEQHAADLEERGDDPDDTRLVARLVFGGPEQIKEECRDARGTRWLEDFCQDVRYTVRTLRQKPASPPSPFSRFALSAGATTVMFTVMNGVLLKPFLIANLTSCSLCMARLKKYGENWGRSHLDFLDLQRQSQSLEMTAWTDGGGTIGVQEANIV